MLRSEAPMVRRQARLRSEYAEWYPDLWAREWHDAEWATEKVLQQQRKGSPAWGLGQRILSEAHFEFQGGDFNPHAGRDRRREIPPICDPIDRP
jgi:hypothetical protein